jgi:hypothetical protein
MNRSQIKPLEDNNVRLQNEKPRPVEADRGSHTNKTEECSLNDLLTLLFSDGSGRRQAQRKAPARGDRGEVWSYGVDGDSPTPAGGDGSGGGDCPKSNGATDGRRGMQPSD